MSTRPVLWERARARCVSEFSCVGAGRCLIVRAWILAHHRHMRTPYWPELGSHRLRKGRISLPGQTYLVTFTAAGRAPIFGDFELACIVSQAICNLDTWPHARLLAWVLMPDHWHGLIESEEAESLSRSVARAKAAATRARGPGNGSGSLWATGYHDRALRSDDAIVDCARHIVQTCPCGFGRELQDISLLGCDLALAAGYRLAGQEHRGQGRSHEASSRDASTVAH